jgi:hypothetical protein
MLVRRHWPLVPTDNQRFPMPHGPGADQGDRRGTRENERADQGRPGLAMGSRSGQQDGGADPSEGGWVVVHRWSLQEAEEFLGRLVQLQRLLMDLAALLAEVFGSQAGDLGPLPGCHRGLVGVGVPGRRARLRDRPGQVGVLGLPGSPHPVQRLLDALDGQVQLIPLLHPSPACAVDQRPASGSRPLASPGSRIDRLLPATSRRAAAAEQVEGTGSARLVEVMEHEVAAQERAVTLHEVAVELQEEGGWPERAAAARAHADQARAAAAQARVEELRKRLP